MLPSYLRHSAGAAWDTVPIWEQKSPAVKTAMFLVAGDIMSSYVGEVSQGSTGGYVAGTSAANENQALP